MRLELHATPEEVMRAVEALREFGQANHIPEKPLFELTLALEECGSNVVNHALRRDARQSFQVIIERAGNGITIELRDSGPQFDPTKAVVESQSGTDEQEPGRWGIQLVRRYMNEI